MTTYDLAKTYYPHLWPKSRLKTLVSANRLTPQEYQSLTKEAYHAS